MDDEDVIETAKRVVVVVVVVVTLMLLVTIVSSNVKETSCESINKRSVDSFYLWMVTIRMLYSMYYGWIRMTKAWITQEDGL